MQGTIVSVDVSVGDSVVAGQQLMLIESMKMHHAIESPCDGTVAGVLIEAGATVMAGAEVASIAPGVVVQPATVAVARSDITSVRADLAEIGRASCRERV